MNVYMVLKDGIPPAFYKEDFHGPAVDAKGVANPLYPPGGIEITEAQWLFFLTKQPKAKWDPTANNGAGDMVDYTPPPPVVPEAVDPRQFFMALAQNGQISQSDCLAYLKTGTLPAPLTAAVNALPSAQQFAAQCLLIGAQTFLRSNPIVPLIGASMTPPMASADLDALWTLAASL